VDTSYTTLKTSSKSGNSATPEGCVMSSVLNAETWAIILVSVTTAALTVAIRLSWRRGKGLGDL
jgi:hypothetical protein